MDGKDPPVGPPSRAGDPVVGSAASQNQQLAIQSAKWIDIVQKVQKEDPEGMEQLYATFSKGLRYVLARQFGPEDLDDKVHEIFLTVVREIRRGNLREPERLMGFVRTIARRASARYVDTAVRTRHRHTDFSESIEIADLNHNPEKALLIQEKLETMRASLRQLSARDREILERFYLNEQPAEQICAEMKLTETQFRLHKSRAKARLGKIGKQPFGFSLMRRRAAG